MSRRGPDAARRVSRPSGSGRSRSTATIEIGFHAEGSGSPYARGALKKLCRPGMSRREAALAALQALYDAADDDSATGGPDLTRRIYPIVSVITEDGFERLAETETEELSRAMVEQRHTRPEGPNAEV
ncbi:hypothetical protein GCM10010228_63340 [Streptomyces massasporeus]|nr:hypothetical protein GCM10010228_63340 [Streptomyces massasporeus]